MTQQLPQATSQSCAFNGESELLNEITEIAERVLWNPAKVSPGDIQKIAAVIVAHARRLRPEYVISWAAGMTVKELPSVPADQQGPPDYGG